jgi:maltose alpha-D-glucosyltransferase/alpha-amylase
MHRALASDPVDPSFAPEPLSETDLTDLAKQIELQTRQSLDALKEQLSNLPEADQALAKEVLAGRSRILEILKKIPGSSKNLLKIRVHGDYHLGQLLWREGDFIILDFEGEPGKSVEERRGKHSPLRDVAGMLRSFQYVADCALHNSTKVHVDALERLEPWSILWRAWISAEFLKAYRLEASELLPDDEATAERLLDWLKLEKTLFELRYELNYRPDWVRNPLLALAQLVRS